MVGSQRVNRINVQKDYNQKKRDVNKMSLTHKVTEKIDKLIFGTYWVNVTTSSIIVAPEIEKI